jgi:WD40 repeat protein
MIWTRKTIVPLAALSGILLLLLWAVFLGGHGLTQADSLSSVLGGFVTLASFFFTVLTYRASNPSPAAERMPGSMPGSMPGRMPEWMPERMAGRPDQRSMSDRWPAPVRPGGRPPRPRSRRLLILSAVLLLITVATGTFAIRQALALGDQRDLTAANALADAAEQVGGTRPDLGQLLAAEALTRLETSKTMATAMSELARPMHRVRVATSLSLPTTVAATADGRTLATGHADGSVQFWDATTGRIRGPAEHGHLGPVLTLAFSADSTMLASGGRDRTVRLWNASTGRPDGQPLDGHAGPVTVVTFWPGRDDVISASEDGVIREWNLRSRTGKRFSREAEPVTALAVSPRGDQVVVGDRSGLIRSRSKRDGWTPRELTRTNYQKITDLEFTPDGRRLVSTGADNQIDLWAAGSQPGRNPGKHLVKHLGELPAVHTDRVTGASFGPDGRTLITSGADGKTVLWRFDRSGPADRRVLPADHQVLPSPSAVEAVVFADGGRRIVAVDARRHVNWWQTRVDQPLGRSLTVGDAPVNAVVFAPDGATLVSGDEKGRLRFWDVAAGTAIGAPLTSGDGSVVAIAYTVDGRELVAGYESGAVVVWDAAVRRELRRFGRPGQVKIWDLALSPDGGTVATAQDDGAVGLWRLSTGQATGALDGHRGPVQGVAFSRTGDELASAGADGTVRRWRTADHAPVGVALTGHQGAAWAVAYTPAGTGLAATGRDRTVQFWDRSGGPPVDVLDGAEAGVDDLAFSPDGSLLATSNGDHTVRVFDARTHRPVGRPMPGHAGWVDGIGFAPHASLLATTGDDGTVRLWDLNRTSWIQQLCERAGRRLTPAEWAQYVGPDADYAPTCPAG